MHVRPRVVRAVGRASARSLGWALTTNFAIAAVVVASTAVGQRLPTSTEAERLEGGWYAVSNTVDGVRVWMTPEPTGRDGLSAVYVGRDIVRRTGFLAPVEESKRVWVADPSGATACPTVREGIREHMSREPGLAGWAEVFAAAGGVSRRTVWWGSAIYGGAFVVPGLIALAGLVVYAGRAGDWLIRWRLARLGRCTGCGYALTGLEVEEAPHCPECGQERTTTEHAEQAEAAEGAGGRGRVQAA
jgi:hypothetical protein